MEHKLKTLPNFFDELFTGVKEFEYRPNDRNFQTGDTLILQEYDPGPETTKPRMTRAEDIRDRYTGRNIKFLVQKVWTRIPGVPDGFCIMKIKLTGYWERDE